MAAFAETSLKLGVGRPLIHARKRAEKECCFKVCSFFFPLDGYALF